MPSYLTTAMNDFPELQTLPPPPRRPFQRSPLQPQELQLVEGEVKDVEAVQVVDEVAHGRRRESG